MATLPAPPPDPTLAAVDTALVQRQEKSRRRYLGASQIGGPCDRALWYSFRWCLEPSLDAASLRRIADGHAGEAVMADRLRLVPGVSLWTVDDETGRQFGFRDLNHHFAGHLDGVIAGLLQATKTPHVWEHKQVGDSKFRELLKLKSQMDEKSVLEKWNGVYFVQAQVYMHHLDLTRHYLTVATPGGRQYASVRTAYQPDAARKAMARAAEIVTANRPPLKLSENPADWRCKSCDFWSICHGRQVPAVNCRTCAHSTATLDRAPWICEHHGRDLDCQDGCDRHLFHPDLLAHRAEAVRVDPKANTISYRTPEGHTFENGPAPALSSAEVRERLNGNVDGMIHRLAERMDMDPLRLSAGELTEADWPRLVSASSAICEESPDQKDALMAAIDLIDGAYNAGMQEAA